MKKSMVVLSILCGGLLMFSTINSTSFAQDKVNIKESAVNKEESSAEVIEKLNQNQAEELLKIYNSEIEYVFQGDENTFGCLKEKGLEGYVFLGNIEGDLGYFVDENTANIYYFHPSGYLEIII